MPGVPEVLFSRFMRALTLLLVAGAAACAPPAPEPGEPIQITDSKAGAFESALAVRDEGFVAAWYDNRDGNAEIYMRLLDGDGQPAGPERRLIHGIEDSYEASIDVIGGALAVAWYDKSAGGGLVPKLGVWELSGRNRWVRSLAAAGRNPVVSVRGDAIFCAWIAPDAGGGESVWGGWWTPDGTLQSSQRLAPAGKTTWNLNAFAQDQGRALVAFDATAGTQADELFLVRFQPQGSAVVRLTADDGKPSKYPDIAVGDRLALTWFDERDGNTEVYLLVAPEGEFSGEIDARARRVTTTTGESIGAYLRWNGDRLGLAWSDDTEGQHEVYFQSFDAAGEPRGSARRLTRNGTSSLIPAIRPFRRGFALTWGEFRPGAEAHAGTSEIWFARIPNP